MSSTWHTGEMAAGGGGRLSEQHPPTHLGTQGDACLCGTAVAMGRPQEHPGMWYTGWAGSLVGWTELGPRGGGRVTGPRRSPCSKLGSGSRDNILGPQGQV